MAIFEKQAKLKPGSRSHTRLVVSGGDSPSEHFILDPKLEETFAYEYGGAGQKDVVIGKGMLVGVKPDAEIDYETGKSKTVITFAGKDGAKVIGMAPYNFAKHTDDFLDGNQPAIITREFVEVPYFADVEKAAAHKYGAAYGDLKIGDLVTFSREPGNLGQMIKYDPVAHNETEIAGQVLALEFDAEVQGWLKWAMFDEAAKNEDLGADKTGYEAPGKGGFPFDPDYRDGTIDVDGYLSQYTSNPTGAPGLFDGMARAKTVHKETVTLDAENAVLNLKEENLIEGSFKLTGLEAVAAKTDVAEGKYFVDYVAGKVHYKVAAEQEVEIEYRATKYGTPPHLDFDGVLGACRVLLRF